MATRLGVNVDPAGAALGSRPTLQESGAAYVRLVMLPNQPTRELVRSYRDRGIAVLPCTDADTERGFPNSIAAASEYERRIGDLVDTSQIGRNEFEGHGPTSSSQAEAELFAQMSAWHSVWKSRRPQVTLVGPGMVSGNPDKWSGRCNALVDAIAVHPYVGEPLQMSDAVNRYRRWGKPIWITEFPWWSEGHGREALRLSDGPAFAFCWQSWRVQSGGQTVEWLDGLLDLNGQRTWRFDSFARLAREVIPPPAVSNQRVLLLSAPATQRVGS